jgi:N-dimethylarginine dimethylaminohydrolase
MAEHEGRVDGWSATRGPTGTPNPRGGLAADMDAGGRALDDVESIRELSPEALPTRPRHGTILLVEPTHFDLAYAINPHMDGEVNQQRAREQWERLRETFERAGADVRVLDPAETAAMLDGAGPDPADRPDMVFAANHAVPTADGAGLVLARMATDERAGEPEHLRAWAEQAGYRVEDPPSVAFEGTGDALWHPGRRLLWGGHGFRTDRAAYDDLAARLDATVVPLELVDDRYYHLDVALAPLSETTALVQPAAFTDEGLAKIRAVFETVLEAPSEESAERLAVNLEVVEGTAITSAAIPETAALLADAGFDVESVDTGEFLKAGGSVFCLALSLGSPPAAE